MASLGDKMVSALFGQSEAEKTFRPWWDNLEDFLVYGLILLGKLDIVLYLFPSRNFNASKKPLFLIQLNFS